MHIPQSLYSFMRFNFLYADRYVFRRGWAYPDSYVPYFILRYILKGRAEFIISGNHYVVGENQVCYIPEGSAWRPSRPGLTPSPRPAPA